jgi:uncharacterized small protein (DUF1192 family)
MVIDSGAAAVNARVMELDDTPRRPDGPIDELIREDLDPLSVAELEARITVLEGEIARSRRKIDHAVVHRSAADQLFRS